MDVDEARGDDSPIGVDRLPCRAVYDANRRNAPAGDRDVPAIRRSPAAVYDRATPNDEIEVHTRASRSRGAFGSVEGDSEGDVVALSLFSSGDDAQKSDNA